MEGPVLLGDAGARLEVHIRELGARAVQAVEDTELLFWYT
jgi:hypothetical protein